MTVKLITEDLSRIDRARTKKKIEEFEKKLSETASRLNVHQKTINLYKSFDQVVFYLSENGKESMEAIKRMSTYDFYRYKEMVNEKVKAMNRDIEKMKNGTS